MLKFSVEVQCGVVDELENFFENEQLCCWAVEKDNITGKYCAHGYFDSKEAGDTDLSKIMSKFPGLPTAEVSEVKKDGWETAYRESAKPWQCKNLRWIPSWMKNDIALNDSDVPVYIEPGMAFGTGTHETTQLCASALIMFQDIYKKTGDIVIKNCIDAGCGSGILGISAIKLGLEHATFIDIDPDAVRIAHENAQYNGVHPDQVDFVVGNIKIGLLGRQTDLLFANILADVLIKNADILVNSVNPGGMLCLSGILSAEADNVKDVFKHIINDRWKSNIDSSTSNGEWTAITFFRG